MKNSLVLLAVVLSVAAFAGMMRIKTDVQTMDRERMRLVRERAELRETKRVLEAEWALLASPERLERLAHGRNYVPASALDVVPLMPVAGNVSATTVVSSSAVVAPVAFAIISPTAKVSVVTVAPGSAIEAGLATLAAEAVSPVVPISGSEQE